MQLRFIQEKSLLNGLGLQKFNISETLWLAKFVGQNSHPVHSSAWLKMLLHFLRGASVINLQQPQSSARRLKRKLTATKFLGICSDLHTILEIHKTSKLYTTALIGTSRAYSDALNALDQGKKGTKRGAVPLDWGLCENLKPVFRGNHRSLLPLNPLSHIICSVGVLATIKITSQCALSTRYQVIKKEP